MIGDEADIELARLRAQLARQRLLGTLGQIRGRLQPSALAADAWETIRDRGGDALVDVAESVKAKPGRAVAIAGLVALFLARRPIADGVRSLLQGHQDETD